MASDPYRWLALYYDHFFEYVRPLDSARKEIVEPLLPRVSAACDLCCGSGNLSLRFAAQGIRTFAVDWSPEFCRIVRAKAAAALLPVKVIRADMRSFRLPRQVDLVTCEFDALNHVPRKTDLAKVLKCVAAALKPGGHFAFDVNNRLGFETYWSNVWFAEREPVTAVMRSSHEPGSGRAVCEIDWFIREGKLWRRRHERVEEVCWTAAEIRAALKAAGFQQIKTWDAAPFFNDKLTLPGCRTFWRARKKA